MKTKLAMLVAALLAMSSIVANAVTVSVGVYDRPYYIHGPGYWYGGYYYLWVPGYWVWHHHHRHWHHGYYVVRR